MLNIMKNTWKLFTRNKEYFSITIVTPLLMLLLFSFLVSYQNKINISVIDFSKNELSSSIKHTLDDLEYINIMHFPKENVDSKIADGTIESAIFINENAKSGKDIEIISPKNSTVSKLLYTIVNASITSSKKDIPNSKPKVTINEVLPKGIPIVASIGFIIFKFIGNGSLLGDLIIKDRNNGIRNRIKLSGLSTSAYLAGISVVYLITSSISSLAYFIFATLFRFDFGMQNPILILLILFMINILSTALFVCVSAFTSKQKNLWYMSVLVILPASILSGAFVSFDLMPSALQKVGSIFPQRWFVVALERMQANSSFIDYMTPLFSIFVLSCALFFVGAYKINKNKI